MTPSGDQRWRAYSRSELLVIRLALIRMRNSTRDEYGSEVVQRLLEESLVALLDARALAQEHAET